MKLPAEIPGLRRHAVASLALLALLPAPAAAESKTDVSLGLGLTRFSQFDDTTTGIVASVSRRLSRGLAVDAQLGFSPSDLGTPAFSASQTYGFVGLRAGVPVGRARVFAAARPGFVQLAEAPAPFACIAIFPPPLACALGSGDTLFGVQLGAGLEAFPGERTVLRIEVGSLLLRYSGPAFAKDREPFQDSLWSHNLRASVSLGFMF